MMIKRPQPENKLRQETKIRTMHSLWLESLSNHDNGEETVKKHLILQAKQRFWCITGTFGRPQQDTFYGERRHTPWDTHDDNFFPFFVTWIQPIRIKL